MAEKDITQKILEAYNDVFSDIVNVLLFQGRQILKEDELEEQAPRSYYKADGKVHETERDVAKRWKKGNIRIACVGLENHTESDPDMPLRVIGYDGAEYRAQLLQKREDKRRYPVVTLVLYFGYQKRWSQPTRLLERLNVPEEFLPFVNDYKINLFEIAYLTREQVNWFRSDFKIVADYFVQMREKNDYTPEPVEFTHVQETLQLLSVMTGDNRFEEVYNENVEGGPRNMCEVLDRIENRGIQQGRMQGIEQGRIQGIEQGRIQGIEQGRMQEKKENALTLHELGMNEEFIAQALKVSVEVVRQWLGLLPA